MEELLSLAHRRLAAADELRRLHHNVIQELRGNVRVFVRTRPFLPNDPTPRGTGSTVNVSANVRGRGDAVQRGVAGRFVGSRQWAVGSGKRAAAAPLSPRRAALGCKGVSCCPPPPLHSMCCYAMRCVGRRRWNRPAVKQ